MPSSHDMVITEALRTAYAQRHIIDASAIRQFEYVKAQSSERLNAILSYDPKGRINFHSDELNQFVSELQPEGGYINLNWVIGQVGEELYRRRDMDEEGWLHLQQPASDSFIQKESGCTKSANPCTLSARGIESQPEPF